MQKRRNRSRRRLGGTVLLAQRNLVLDEGDGGGDNVEEHVTLVFINRWL